MAENKYQFKIKFRQGGIEHEEIVQMTMPQAAGSYKMKFTMSDGSTFYAKDDNMIPPYQGNALIILNKTPRTYRIKAKIGNRNLPESQAEEVVVGTFTTPSVDFSLQDADWDTISEISRLGIASEFFSVGNEKTITLSTGEELTLVIIGFNHDDLADGSGKAGITFQTKHLHYDQYSMNDTNSNDGGWEQSDMRTVHLNQVYSELPSALTSVIKTVNKKTYCRDGGLKLVTTSDKLFLLSTGEIVEREQFYEQYEDSRYDGFYDYYDEEGDVYDYFKQYPHVQKKMNNGTGMGYSWWLRSSWMDTWNDNNLNTFMVRSDLFSSADLGFNKSSQNQGIAFAFCV